MLFDHGLAMLSARGFEMQIQQAKGVQTQTTIFPTLAFSALAKALRAWDNEVTCA